MLTKEQRELTSKLIEASKAYYHPNMAEIMSDYEFDRLREKLIAMEKESGVILSGSPTVHVGGVSVDGLEKRKHEQPALSLDKFKYEDVEKLKKFLGGKDAFVSWKMDGLTIVLTYDDGSLKYAVTRGSEGIEGDVVTHNAVFFKGIPHKIPYKGHLVVRGEAVMTYKEFERINEKFENKYKNPRNLAGATVQMLDSEESKEREICFKAFELVSPAPGKLFDDPKEGMTRRMEWVASQGIDAVDHHSHVKCEDIVDEVEAWKEKVERLPYPTDGLVITFEDQVYAESLGSTGHHARGSIALKWTDETETTTLKDIEWSVGKTGVITPVAIFDLVELGAGSTVTRASLHNISVMKSVPEADQNKGHMMLGSRIEVGLANMIIPQVFSFHKGGENLSEIDVPDTCPVCGMPTKLNDSDGVLTLYCTNEKCAARQLGKLMNTFSREALNVKGLGESQIIDLLEAGLVDETAASFFRMKDHPAEKIESLLQKDGWGKKKWENLLAAIETARNTTLQKFMYGLNVTYLGSDLSKKLSAYWRGSIGKFVDFIDRAAEKPAAALEELTALDGVGEGKAAPLVEWAGVVRAGTKERKDLDDLISYLRFDTSAYEGKKDDASLSGLTFVITGAVNVYKNRDEFKASVEARGGKVAGSVSKKTDYLVNNDTASMSGKNKKAKELGIPVISEDEFIERFGK